MDFLNERVSYLRGLAEGMEISNESKEGKLLLNILDVLEDFVDSMDGLSSEIRELDDYVETIDEDLAEVENELFEELYDDDEDDEEDIEFIEVECPNCHEVISFDEEFIKGIEENNGEYKVVCPSCHEKIYFEDCCEHENDCCEHHNE